MRRSSQIHFSLTQHRMVMGVGSEVFGLEAALLVMALNLQLLLLGLIVIPLHLFFRWVYKIDPILMKAYLRYMKEADLYDPWVRRHVQEKRPEGFGRGLHC